MRLKWYILLLSPLVYPTLLSCPSHYEPCGSLCINFTKDVLQQFCGAFAICAGIEGRLALDNELKKIQSCIKTDLTFYTGVTDLLIEKYSSRTGWLNYNGSVVQDTNIWIWGEPNNDNSGEDCTAYNAGGLNDITCDSLKPFVCVHDPTIHNSKIFVKDDANIYNNNDKGCYKTINVDSKQRCSILCLQDPVCYSFYYEDSGPQCVLVKYVRSTLTKNPNTLNKIWHGYHQITP